MYDCRKGECGLCLLDVAGVEGIARPPRRLPQHRPAGARQDDLDLRVQGRLQLDATEPRQSP